MIENPQIPLEPDQTGKTNLQADQPPSDGQDYVSEIRQNLSEEEADQARRARSTGGLFKRITGSLRRVTGPLRTRTAGAAEKTPVPAAEEIVTRPLAEEEMADDFLTDRLSGLSVSDFSSQDSPAIEPSPVVEEAENFDRDAAANPFLDRENEETTASAGDPQVLDWNDPLMEDAPPQPTFTTMGWVGAARQDAGDTLSPTPDSPESLTTLPQEPSRSSHATGTLRSFITGILRGGEENRRQNSEFEMDDEQVTGRLERSLTTRPFSTEEALGSEESAVPGLPDSEELSGTARRADLTGKQEGLFKTPGEEEAFDPGSVFFETQDEPRENYSPLRGGEPDVFTGSGEDGLVTWENERSFRANETEFQPEAYSPFAPQSNNDYASLYLTGQEAPQVERVDENLLRKALDKAPENERPASVVEMRAIALEDYSSGVEDRPVETEEIFASLSPKSIASWKTWFSSRTTTQKVLLTEAAVVVLALVIAIPFFIIMIIRGGANAAGAPRSLPADLPYPVSLVLPGGWQFELEKSTFTNGKWRPAGGEWLEGTELRRVIALPWNRQTEAVVQTFQVGDKINLTLSNQDKLIYRIEKIDRVPVDDVTILSDRKPSLAIILYEEKAKDRWVVICRP